MISGLYSSSVPRLPSWRRSRSGFAAVVSGLAFFLLALGASPALAQGTGQVAGQVTNSNTGEPMDGAQVTVRGTQIGGLTDADGRFSLRGVPAGEQTIRVRLIGFGTRSRTVTVQGGQTTTANFQLERQALDMQEIVVTGQAGAAQRREIGNAISQIDSEQLNEASVSTEGVLQGQSSGLVISEVSGSAGSGATIRLRGNTSVTQGNQPLIYVDGVRIRSEGYPKNVPPVGYSGRSANVAASPLNDINPQSIERVEIIKGAAATTLYGTEASAGVIQIFTKSGTQGGGPRFNGEVGANFDHMQAFGPRPEDFTQEQFKEQAREDFSHMGLSPWLRNSVGHNYSLSVRGGLEDISYFVSGDYSNDRAPMPVDWTGTGSVRGNFGFDIAPNLNLSWNTSYTKRDIRQTPSGNNAHGLTLQAYRRDRNYVGTGEKVVIDSVLDYDIRQGIDHLTTGATFRWQPTTGISHRFTAGYDRAYSENRQVRPFGFILAPQGKMSNTRFTAETMTLDYAGSFTINLSDQLDSDLSVGGQYVIENETNVTGYAEDFPGPSLPTISTGGLTLSRESRILEHTAGVFAQNRFGFADKLFLTTGIRFDGNSAFGQGITWDAMVAYPKVSMSYLISDEEFFPEAFSTFKLRGAWGMSGRAPGAFDKVKTWESVQFGQSPGFLPQNLGNPELEPEKTAEFEVGFDATFLQDRVTTEFTYYNSTTTDALLPVRQIPSQGGWNSQAENVGELSNTGIELSLNATAVETDDWRWSLGGNLSTNHSNVEDLGSATSFGTGGLTYVREGHPVPVVVGDVVTNPDELAAPEYEEQEIGPNQPTLTIQPTTTIRGPGGVTLRARGEFQGGHYIFDTATWNGIVRSVRWASCLETHNTAFDQDNLGQVTAYDRARCIADDVASQGAPFIYPGDFFKLRNLSLQVPMTEVFSSVYSGFRNVSLTLSARNAVRWINGDFRVFDPEMSGNVGHLSFERSISEHVPPAA
nr:SusC/RagA family TonB-linked outer membrane protein [Candidatus Palauibacterales bacterium]